MRSYIAGNATADNRDFHVLLKQLQRLKLSKARAGCFVVNDGVGISVTQADGAIVEHVGSAVHGAKSVLPDRC